MLCYRIRTRQRRAIFKKRKLCSRVRDARQYLTKRKWIAGFVDGVVVDGGVEEDTVRRACLRAGIFRLVRPFAAT